MVHVRFKIFFGLMIGFFVWSLGFSFCDEKQELFKTSFVEFSGGISVGGAGSGYQREAVNAVLTPMPDHYYTFNSFILADLYPLRYFGLECGFAFLGNVIATSVDVSEELGVYTFNYLQGGTIIRFPFKMSNKDICSYFFGGGVTYNFLGVTRKLKSKLLYGDTMEALDPDWGWYIKGGLNFYMRRLLVGTSFQYNLVRAGLADATGIHDGTGNYFQGQFYLGVYF